MRKTTTSGMPGGGSWGSVRSRITLWVVLTLAALLLLAAAAIGGYIWNGLRPAACGNAKKS